MIIGRIVLQFAVLEISISKAIEDVKVHRASTVARIPGCTSICSFPHNRTEITKSKTDIQ
jgi:hypothetical protein